MRRAARWAVVLGIWGGCAAARAATLTVPGQYATIQAAIEAAQPGDEVVVSPGTYDNVVLSISRPITVRSTYDGSDWSAVENTVLRSSFNGYIVKIWVSGVIFKGFTLRHEPVSIGPGANAMGILSGGAAATIDSCIIENCATLMSGGSIDPPRSGAAISGIHGTIQNCIIRNNTADGAAVDTCRGTFRNNVVYGNSGVVAVSDFTGNFINNTVFDEGGVIASGVVLNNIFWKNASTPPAYGGVPPRNCIIKGYSGPGIGIITSDPKFVDPANGDFHLQADSPAIDAGITTATVGAADINGVQRGLKGVQAYRGDGSAVDIGACEFLPQPVAVWIPGGTPDAIHPGDVLPVAWQVDAGLGPLVRLALRQDSIPRGEFGTYLYDTATTATLRGRTVVTLPPALPSSVGYAIRAISIAVPSATGQTPFFAILGIPSAARREAWGRYP